MIKLTLPKLGVGSVAMVSDVVELERVDEFNSTNLFPLGGGEGHC